MALMGSLPEKRTLAQISSAADTINALGSVRKYWNQPLVCRITDHAHDTFDDGTDPTTQEELDQCAIFKSVRHGEPWQKVDNCLERIVAVADADPVLNPTPSNATVIYPNFDYATFV